MLHAPAPAPAGASRHRGLGSPLLCHPLCTHAYAHTHAHGARRCPSTSHCTQPCTQLACPGARRAPPPQGFFGIPAHARASAGALSCTARQLKACTAIPPPIVPPPLRIASMHLCHPRRPSIAPPAGTSFPSHSLSHSLLRRHSSQHQPPACVSTSHSLSLIPVRRHCSPPFSLSSTARRPHAALVRRHTLCRSQLKGRTGERSLCRSAGGQHGAVRADQACKCCAQEVA